MSGSLSLLVGFHRSVYGREPDLVLSVPGRLDFLNTHQDYKGLPVVAMAINRRLFVGVSRGREGSIRVASLNLKREGKEFMDEFPGKRPPLRGGKWFGDYARAALRALEGEGFRSDSVDVSISSEIPMGAGMASSAALTVGIIAAVSSLLGYKLGLDAIAELAYRAERHVMGIPCGRLDQYSIVYGGVVLIETREPVRVERLAHPMASVIVADSGIRHRTGEIHPVRQRELDEALRILKASKGLPRSLLGKLGDSHGSTLWDAITREELEKIRWALPEHLYNRIAYTVMAHESTIEAIRLLRGEKPETEKLAEWAELVDSWLGGRVYASPSSLSETRQLGLVTTYQHCLLSLLYDVSLGELDSIVRFLVLEGALGAKLSGAGLGGIVMGLADHDRAVELVDKARGRLLGDYYVVSVDEGLKLH
ncbi:MAG: GHMP kinase [Desulfurococcales archaeon]|nr:GHMP kinase [Desulfurococcales archaeon]